MTANTQTPTTWRLHIEDGKVTSFAPVGRRIRGGEYFTGSAMELASRYYDQMTPEADALLAREIYQAIAKHDRDQAHRWFNSLMSRWSNHFSAHNQNQARERRLAWSVRAIIDGATHQDWQRPTVAQIIQQYAKDHASAEPKLRMISRDTIERIFRRWEARGIVQIDHAKTRDVDDREYGDSWRRNRHDWNLALVSVSGGPEAHYLTNQDRNVAALSAALSAVLPAALFAALTSPTVPPVRAAGTVSRRGEGIDTKIDDGLSSIGGLRPASGEHQEGETSATPRLAVPGEIPPPLGAGMVAGAGAELKADPEWVDPEAEYEAALPLLAWLWLDDNEPRVSLLRSRNGNRQRRHAGNSLKLVKLTGNEKSGLLDEKRRAGRSLREHCQMLHDKYLDPETPDLFDVYHLYMPVLHSTPEHKLLFWVGRQSRTKGEAAYFCRVDKRQERIVSDEKLVRLTKTEANWLLAMKERWEEHPDYSCYEDGDKAYEVYVMYLYNKVRNRDNEEHRYAERRWQNMQIAAEHCAKMAAKVDEFRDAEKPRDLSSFDLDALFG